MTPEPGDGAAAEDLPRLLRPRSRIVDITVAAVVTLFTTAGAVVTPLIHSDAERALQIVMVLVAGAALFFRRRQPVAVLGVTLVAAAVEGLLQLQQFAGASALVALYTVGTLRPIDVVAVCDAVTVAAFATSLRSSRLDVLDVLGTLASHAAFVVAPSALGIYLQTRRRHNAALVERADRLARERDLLAERAVAEERVRIARELHDVVAHHVSLMVVEAGAVRATLGDDHPGSALLDELTRTGREALSEMRRLLGVLRTPGGGGELAPQPGVDALADLVESVRRSGLEVTLTVRGRRVPLAAGVELTVHRIVQEALTNTVKHAHATRADVTLEYGEDSVRVRVVDDGRGGEAAPGGHGLPGMRERVLLHAGTVAAGPGEAGGFAVEAEIPLHDAAAVAP